MLTQASRIHDRSWVVQCALSRICGGCAMSLGRPVAFLGTAQEVGRNAFHLPPLHVECAEELARELAAGPGAGTDWRLVRTAGFEFARPGRDDADQQPRFVPNSLL
ncbi:MAG TPA: hypothetical protein VHZ06_03365 [Marmoricola sp.]|jgi:hypothetical protein|nr:hypothetical protein [Marmoricola sp.]